MLTIRPEDRMSTSPSGAARTRVCESVRGPSDLGWDERPIDQKITIFRILTVRPGGVVARFLRPDALEREQSEPTGHSDVLEADQPRCTAL